MDIIKKILIEDLDTINKSEKRDGKPYFNSQFIANHPYLCIGMVAAYIPLAILVLYAPYFGLYWMLGFTALFIILAAVLLFDIKPVYRFEDIGVLDLRVCYNGEWFVTEKVSDTSIQKILDSNDVSSAIKQEITRLVELKGMVSFYDIYHIAYPEVPTRVETPLMTQNKAQYQ
ncbi:YlaC family protein [Providencia vermicola]|uniref:YlaC family protein n=2 Tax=Providencia TaxID=586 RepID=A0AAI9MXE6_PROST|nr:MULTISPECIES: YlaC family protein [Providencia]ELR5044461.1 YlaC family protein [Providencia rettgeri]ELR5036954.1 YlaC family protein [Providencia stuartii]ELR5120437.1 YlaC family protein [Providencia stuartii]ELR5142983.1 YlaC family protein [Providencia stuartii]ELR5291961.1 YlaC family protein [Providencia stuartii]